MINLDNILKKQIYDFANKDLSCQAMVFLFFLFVCLFFFFFFQWSRMDVRVGL